MTQGVLLLITLILRLVMVGNLKVRIWRSLFVLIVVIDSFLASPLSGQYHKSKQLSGAGLELPMPYPDSVFASLKRTAEAAREKGDRGREAGALRKVGLVLYHEADYGPAINYLQEAKKIYQEDSRFSELALTANQLGRVYYYNRQKTAAMQQFQQALRIFQRLRDERGLAGTYGEIGHIYEKNASYDSAKYYQRLALQHFIHLGDSAGIGDIYENMASIMEDQEHFDSSLYYYKAALRLNNNPYERIDLINNLGDIYRKTGQPEKGLPYSRNAMVLSEAFADQYQLGSAYRDIGRSFGDMHVFDSAYYYTELARVAQKKIYETENARQISLMQVHFETEKKNLRIAKLSAEKRANIIIGTASIIILVLLLILSVLIYLRQKVKTRTEKQMREAQQQVYQTERGLLESELKNKGMEEQRLKQQLELKSKELSAHILHLIQKNEALEAIKADLNELIRDEKRDHKRHLKLLLHKINLSANQDVHWQEFRTIFEQVHQSFFDKIRERCANLTAGDMRLIALLKMNVSSTDISTLLGVSGDSLRVFRYRLRRKLGLEQGENLTTYLQSI